jgi:hypothetical protein
LLPIHFSNPVWNGSTLTGRSVSNMANCVMGAVSLIGIFRIP